MITIKVVILAQAVWPKIALIAKQTDRQCLTGNGRCNLEINTIWRCREWREGGGAPQNN